VAGCHQRSGLRNSLTIKEPARERGKTSARTGEALRAFGSIRAAAQGEASVGSRQEVASGRRTGRKSAVGLPVYKRQALLLKE